MLIVTQALVALAGLATGVYTLPILTAPAAPTAIEMSAARENAQYSGQFRRELKGSDFLHWGEGKVSVGSQFISLQGSIAPGPDYRLYLSPEFVETEEEFFSVKADSVQIDSVKSFAGFVSAIPAGVEIEKYNTVVIWCEQFEEFITAARYKM